MRFQNERARANVRDTVHAVSLLLHQLPRDVWHHTAYDECLALLKMNAKSDGRPAAGGIDELHDFDREQIAAFRAAKAAKKPT